MKRWLLLTLLCVLSPLGLRAQVTVSGNLKDAGLTNITSLNSYVRFTLAGYGSNIPRVNGSNAILTPYKDFHPDANGNISGTIQGNDTITIGGNSLPGGTWYQVCLYDKGIQFRCATYTITGGSFNLNNATPNTTTPTVPAPTGDNTYLRKDAGNSPLTGALSSNSTISDAGGTHSGTETFTGAPAISATNAGVFTNTQSQFYLQSLLNSCNPTTEFNVTQGGAGVNTTDALTGCVAIPVGSTVHQANGLAGYASVSSASTNGVGVYGQSRCLVNNTNCWGANNLVQDFAGLTGHSMNGLEIDVNVLGTPTAARGLLIAGASTGTMPANSPAIAIGAPGTGKLWNTAISVTDAASVNGIAIGTTGTGNSVSSQPINLTGRDSGGVSHTTAIQADQFGNLSINAIAGKNVVIPATTGLEIGEGAATAGGVGQDTCYGDSTLHMLKCSYNNGSFLPVPQTNNAGGTHSDSGLYQTKRAVAGCTTGAAAGNSCASDITVTWGTAFADANYSVTCTGSTPTNVPSAPFVVSASKLAASVHINYFAITAAAASYATIDCIAVHD